MFKPLERNNDKIALQGLFIRDKSINIRESSICMNKNKFVKNIVEVWCLGGYSVESPLNLAIIYPVIY